MPKTILTQDRLQELLSYNPETGYFIWAKNLGIRIKAGDIAGTHDKDGYILIGIDCSRYKLHRLAFLYMTGSFPIDEVDHLNHVKDDNRWSNLRHATRTINQRNRVNQKNNTSGRNGVYWKKRTQKWHANICLAGKLYHLGYFNEFGDAVAARVKAEKEHGFIYLHQKKGRFPSPS
jgi:hypothetical protein